MSDGITWTSGPSKASSLVTRMDFWLTGSTPTSIVMPMIRQCKLSVIKRRAQCVMWADAATLRLLEADAVALLEHDRYWSRNGEESQT